MELYHLHLLGNHDRLYKEKSEFVVDKDKFNNRIYDRIYNMNSTVEISKYQRLVNILNNLCMQNGMPPFNDRISLGEIIEMILRIESTDKELLSVLMDAKDIIFAESINMREMAMEEYRKENCINLPSRLHSLYACSEEGLDFWVSRIFDTDVDIYRIEVYDEPFLSNEQLLPSESLPYGEKIKQSYKYFHPKNKDLIPVTNEYLIQGKVKILEKVGETRIE